MLPWLVGRNGVTTTMVRLLDHFVESGGQADNSRANLQT